MLEWIQDFVKGFVIAIHVQSTMLWKLILNLDKTLNLLLQSYLCYAIIFSNKS